MSVTTLTTPSQSHSSIDIITLDDASLDKALHLIDQELLRLEDSIRALRFRRNDLAPISQLSPEILSKIFADYVAECTESVNPLEWIRVTHVSRHWRAVALDCPSLWGNFDFTRREWTEEMLKRSKMTGLVIKADLSHSPKIFEAVRLALLHAPRIHDLQLRVDSTSIARLLKPSLQFPVISSLSLTVTLAPYPYDFTLSDTVLTGETPHLRRLRLEWVDIDWNSRFLRNLTHLSIHYSERPTMEQLLNTLERMPALEVFDIQNALPLSDCEQPSAVPIVNLHHLALLSITSTVPECVNFVSLLTIPTNARVNLSCKGTDTTEAEFFGDFSGLMRVVSNLRGSAYHKEKDKLPERKFMQTLHVRYTLLTLVIHGWTNVLAPHEADPCINVPDTQLNLSWEHHFRITPGRVAAFVCRAIPITPIRSLRIAYVDDISSKVLIDIFGHSLELHSVHIEGCAAHAFVSALRKEAPIEALTSPLATPEGLLEVKQPSLCQRRSAVPSVYFPQLRSLTLEDVKFDESSTYQKNLAFRDLQKCLVERLERKAEIQKLCLRKCSNLNKYNVQALRNLVGVDWDQGEKVILLESMEDL